MKPLVRSWLGVLLTLLMGCVDFQQEERRFCERNPERCESPAFSGLELVFTTAPQAVQVGACSAVNAVQLRDTQGIPVSTEKDRMIALSASPAVGIQFFAALDCMGEAVTSVLLPARASSATFYFKAYREGPVSVTASIDSISVSQEEVIKPSPVVAMEIVLESSEVSAGDCVSGGVQVKDSGGNTTSVESALEVSLRAEPSQGFTFHSSADCGAATSQMTVEPGQSTGHFWFRGTRAGRVKVTPLVTGFSSVSREVTIKANSASGLRFNTLSHTVKAGECSPLVILQALDEYINASPMEEALTVTLQRDGTTEDSTFQFYSDAGCAQAISSVEIPAGEAEGRFYYRGTKARHPVTLRASSHLPTATQEHAVIGGDAATLFFSPATPAATLLASTCTLRTVDSYDAHRNPSTNEVSLSLDSTAGVEFFSDAQCTQPSGELTIPEGSHSADFYFKAVTGGINAHRDITLTISAAGVPSATQTESIVPTVRTGACAIAPYELSVICPIQPALTALDKTMLFFQATSTGQYSSTTNVRCFMKDVSLVECARGGVSALPVNIQWSAAELPSTSGVSVQHRAVDCQNDTTTAEISVVGSDQTFLLLSSRRSVSSQDASVPRFAQLTSTTQVQIHKLNGCGGGAVDDTNHLQVVEYPGAKVQRGLANPPNGWGSHQASLLAAVAPDRSLLLYSWILDDTGDDICGRVLRGQISATGSMVTFSRGNGNTNNCDDGGTSTRISWEVVEFPERTLVHQLTQEMNANVKEISIALPTEVDPSRTLVFAGGQWASGQVHGEGRYRDGQVIGEMRARATLTEDGRSVRLIRESANDSAKFTFFVVQLRP